MPTIYIAGKIQSERGARQVVDNSVFTYEEYLKQGPIKIDNFFIYSGPFVIGCDHKCFHGPSTHGAGANKDSGCGCGEPDENGIFNQCVNQIRKSNLFLAWIDSPDYFGTISELGFQNPSPI